MTLLSGWNVESSLSKFDANRTFDYSGTNWMDASRLAQG
jgi:hypothetical protein